MTRTDSAALALRIAALYLCVSALFQATTVVVTAFQLRQFDEAEFVLAGSAVAAVLLTIAGIGLFLAAPTLARRMTDGDANLQLKDRAAIGSIALRIAGVVLWDAALQGLPAVNLTANTAPWAHFAVQVAVVVLFAGVGSWLFACAPALGARWFGSTPVAATTNASILPSIAFAAIGLFVLLSALPTFLLSVVDVVRSMDAHATGLNWDWRQLISSLLRLVLGMSLVLGSGGVARLWERVSTAGLNRRSDAT